MKSHTSRVLIIVIASLFAGNLMSFSQDAGERDSRAEGRLSSWINPLTEFSHIASPRIDSVTVIDANNIVNVYFAPQLSYYPFREYHIQLFNESLKNELGWRYRRHTINSYSNGFKIEQLVPNLYRNGIEIDITRIIRPSPERPVLIRRKDEPVFNYGLFGKGIALWQSHGYYYEASLDRWEWQRAKLFGTVEDISTMAYVTPYLVPMLEKAGANVFMPRERDTGVNEVIVDNDISTAASEVIIQLYEGISDTTFGFRLADTIFSLQNPFRMGTALRVKGGSAIYLPDIPESGNYALYVSWPSSRDNSSSVEYSVRHTGGTTSFEVDQTVGGPTWHYLGTFYFREGKDTINGSVAVSDLSGEEAWVGLDAMKFGGGMGNVARRPAGAVVPNQRSVDASVQTEAESDTIVPVTSWKISGKPRYTEGARYWLQYAGMPDSLVYTPNVYRNDYNDDYMSRALWVNYLSADPGDDADNPAGLGVPVDIAFAFHTDAGITPNDSIIGTLAIYSTATDGGKFPDSTSRMASRDLNDIVQTQIINDIRYGFNHEWTRRGLWDRPYFEARRPNVPAMLLELLSHQNLADQQYGLDPRFRFATSRAIYKGMLRYFAYNEGRPYVVQPLPVTGFAVTPAGYKRVRLSWEPQADPVEPSAMPDRYRVYRRTGDNGFDNGTTTENTSVEFELDEYDTVYSFKVTAINDGGESFDSEILAAGISSVSSGNILVVNAFDRICGPEWFDRDGMAGVAWWHDRGVPHYYDFVTIGDQYDFNRLSPWLDDDAPGWGATWSDMEGMVIPGNTFDFSAVQGGSILKAGYSFYSVSDEYFNSRPVDSDTFGSVSIILGEEKSTYGFPDRSVPEFTVYTQAFMDRIIQVTEDGINIFMSGAYVGTDLMLSHNDSTAIKFAARYLGFAHRTNLAVNSGELYSTDSSQPAFTGTYRFNAGYSPGIYTVEAPDAIEPAGRGATTAFRYSQNHTSAGVMYRGEYSTVILGFPFETLIDADERDRLMKQVLDFFKRR
ncbi:MAG: fibronectin type III domain-containing protein [Bacteroidales bacterium]